MKNKKPIKEMVLIKKDRLIFGNSKTEKQKIRNIMDNFNWNKFLPICCFKTGKGYIISDGNHRAKALIAMEEEFIPAILLTEKEFDYVKYSSRIIDMLVKVPEKVKLLR